MLLKINKFDKSESKYCYRLLKKGIEKGVQKNEIKQGKL